jgi:ferredoxin
MHKFWIYPSRFGEVLCTGCGRCARACSAGVDLPEVLRTITALAAPGGPEEAAV